MKLAEYAFNPWTGREKGVFRRRTSEANWKHPLRWNRQGLVCVDCASPVVNDGISIDCRCGQAGAIGKMRRPQVFCASLADWLDDEVPTEWLADLLNLIRLTPNLDWLLLTKRPENFFDRLGAASNWCDLNGKQEVASWINWWRDTATGRPPEHVWIGTSAENQEAADTRIPHLLQIPARVRFLSCEPLLGPLNLGHLQSGDGEPYSVLDGIGGPNIDWVICGGESGKHARPMHPDWARSLRDQCAAAGIPYLFKQWGEWVHLGQSPACDQMRDNGRNPGFHVFDCASCESQRRNGVVYLDRAACKCVCVYAFGKKHTGRLLDGVEHNGFPEVKS